jgi:hypothetical protein
MDKSIFVEVDYMNCQVYGLSAAYADAPKVKITRLKSNRIVCHSITDRYHALLPLLVLLLKIGA